VVDEKQLLERKNEQKQICDKLTNSSNQLYAQILEERKRLQEKRDKEKTQPETVDLTGNERRAKVLKAKAASYAAELESLKEGPVFSSSLKDPLIIQEDLKEELKRNIEQYNDALNNIKGSIISLSNEIEGKQKTHEELQELYEQLGKKENEQMEVQSQNENLADENIQILEKDTNEIKQLLFEFLSENFPKPISNSNSNSSKASSQFWSLQEIIQQLITKQEEDPEDPYVLKDGHHYGPYIELLLRAKVAQVHPKDNRYIRLADFS